MKYQLLNRKDERKQNMSQWFGLAKTRINNSSEKPTILTRIKIGKVLMVYASLPLFSAWAYAFAIPMMIPLKPSLWAKDKIRDIKEWWVLR